MSENLSAKGSNAVMMLAGVGIELREDYYIPLSFLKTGDKTYKDLNRDFSRKGRLSQLLEAEATRVTLVTLAKSDDFSVRGLIEVNNKTGVHFSGFLHPRAALVIAICWFNPEIASEVINWYYRFLTGDATLLHDVADRVDLVHGTKSLLTHTVADKNESDETLAAAHAAAAKYQAEVVMLQSQLRDANKKREQDLADANNKYKQDLSDADNKYKQDLSDANKKREQNLSDQADKSSAEISRLTAQLAALGVDSQQRTNRLTCEVRKRRRMCKLVRLNDEANEKILATHLLQTADESVEGPGEAPGCNSMPARFIALRGVNEATNGLDNKIVHALIKECLAAIGENLMKYKRAHAASRSRLLGCISAIIDDQAEDNAKNPLTSNVFLVNLLCANIKRVHGLQHATHLTLGALYTHVRRVNRWFTDHLMCAEFQLVQADDLAVLLGYDNHEQPRLLKYNPCDMRVHFPMAGEN